MVNYYSNQSDFLISNFERYTTLPNGMIKTQNDRHVFGYCLSSTEYFQNETISSEQFALLKTNNIDCSGVFVAIELHQDRAELIIDPLCQFNIFYFSDGNRFVISSSIEAMKTYLHLSKINDSYLYDQIAYQSPIRGQTILENVFYIQFDDVANRQQSRKEFIHIDTNSLIRINRPNYQSFDDLSYTELCRLYTERLNMRANVVASRFDKIHVQLTGGADSRLALSGFSQFDNVECYVYGNGESQDRLVFEEIIRARNIAPVSEIKFVGQPLSCPNRILKGLLDSNFLKFNNLNTYMNGGIESDKKYCKITGYYGANISGGVAIPPKDTASNPRLKSIPTELFTYHDYVEDFTKRHEGLRSAAFNDRFYINNRGKGHYASHSIADNKSVASIDILYDYINLLLVEKCPYSDWEIDKNAVSIDLIYENDKALALFPYDSRRVPNYRTFKDIPLINCFDGYLFSSRQLEDFKVVKPKVSTNNYQLLEEGNSFLSIKEMLNLNEIQKLSSEYKELLYLNDCNDIQANIFLYFLLGQLYMQQ